MRRAVPLACLALGLLASSSAEAQAWLRGAGEVLLVAGVSRSEATGFYGPDRRRTPLAHPLTQTLVTLYTEAGLVDRRLMLTVEGVAWQRNELQGQGATTGMGDLRAGAWLGLAQEGPLHVSAGLIAGLPTGDPAPDAPGDDPEADDIAGLLPTGDGEWDLTSVLAAGTAFGGADAQVRVGYAFRSLTGEAVADGAEWSADLGYRPVGLERVRVSAGVRGLESFASNAESGAAFIGLGQGVTYTVVGAAVSVRASRSVGLHAGADAPVRGRNIADAGVLRIGLSWSAG